MPSFCKDDIVTVVGVSTLLELELPGVVTDSTTPHGSSELQTETLFLIKENVNITISPSQLGY